MRYRKRNVRMENHKRMLLCLRASLRFFIAYVLTDEEFIER